MATKRLVLGLGNPILGDDGVGWKVAEQLQKDLTEMDVRDVEIDCLAVGGLSLMERMVGYEQVILVDAITTQQHPLGAVLVFPLEQLPNRAFGHLSSAHDTTLQNALAVGRKMGVSLPDEIWVVGIEASQVYDFSEVMSPPIQGAVDQAVGKVKDLLRSRMALQQAA